MGVKMKQGSASGETVLSLAGHSCFIPYLLPPKLELDVATHRRIGVVMHLLGQVQAYRRLLPSVEVLIYGALRREALASSTIEGTIASADELVLYEIQGVSERSAVREVSNYSSALQKGRELVRQRPITLNLILELHSTLLNGVRGQGAAGRLKIGQNHIGSHHGQSIEDALFVPPPPERTSDLMSDLEKYINLDPAEPPLIQVALTHYQFETIHPFGDGNGRVGRLVMILQLIQLGLLDDPLVYPSVYIERTRDRYIEALQGVRDRGDWQTWIEYFLEVMETQVRETLRVAELLMGLLDRVRLQLTDGRRAVSVERALNAFFHAPVLTAREVQEHMGSAYNTTRSALETLADAKIVERIGDRKRDQAYLCRPLFDLLFFGK
ncbi:Fic family protein [bacterium]|nr:MAG: Fic family protein [bacterium]